METIVALKSDEQASLSPGAYQVLTTAVAQADLGPLGIMRRRLRGIGAACSIARCSPDICRLVEALLNAPEWEAAAMAGRAPERLPLEPWLALFHAANAIHGAIDEQTYDERRHASWDTLDEHEFSVNITAGEMRALGQAVAGVEAHVKAAHDAGIYLVGTRSQRMREAGFTRRPSAKSLPSDE